LNLWVCVLVVIAWINFGVGYLAGKGSFRKKKRRHIVKRAHRKNPGVRMYQRRGSDWAVSEAVRIALDAGQADLAERISRIADQDNGGVAL
jgi:hypothetical protein